MFINDAKRPGVNFIKCFAPYANLSHLKLNFYANISFSKVGHMAQTVWRMAQTVQCMAQTSL